MAKKKEEVIAEVKKTEGDKKYNKLPDKVVAGLPAWGTL